MWYLPVGLYADQMDSLQSLQANLQRLGVDEDTHEMRALRDVLNYFKGDANDAYLTMKQLDKHVS